jgi:hypothetical protein
MGFVDEDDFSFGAGVWIEIFQGLTYGVFG